MNNTLNIVTVVNGALIASKGFSAGTAKAPTPLGSYGSSDTYISMVAPNSNVDENDGRSELAVHVNPGDNIQWSMTTFADDSDYTAFIYDGRINALSAGLIDIPLTMSTSPVIVHVPDPNKSFNSDILIKNINYVSTANAKINTTVKSLQYTLSFKLVDNSNGRTVGYFNWDPFINVNQG